MAPAYTIMVQNDSGMRQNYNITQEAPRVDNLSGKTWPLVIDKARVPPQDSAEFSIEIPNPYYAYALSSQGPLEHGTSAQIISKVPANIGTRNNGSNTPGSTIKYVVDDGTPSVRDTKQSNAPEKCFSVVTGSDFRESDAKRDNYLLGYGSKNKAWSVFTPSPQSEYRIFPSAVFYLFTNDFREGQIVNVQAIGKPVKLDFSTLQNNSVKVTHTDRGELVVQN